MAYNIARCIEWVSSIHALEPGDVLAMGTNHRGLSSVQDGDMIELDCGGIGRLKIFVRDDLKRRWPRETRAERTEQGLPPLPPQRSEEHTSELQSLMRNSYAVLCLTQQKTENIV